MRIRVKVHARSREDSVKLLEDGSYRVNVKALPADGKANAAVCVLLAKHFKTSKSAVRVFLGGTSANKVIEIDTAE